jgi:hypothetical protein
VAIFFFYLDFSCFYQHDLGIFSCLLRDWPLFNYIDLIQRDES